MGSFQYVPLLLVTAVFMNAAEPPDILDRIRTAQSVGDFRQAANLYKQLIASGQDTPELRSNAAAMLHFSGQDGEALVQARVALSRNPALAGANLIAGASLVRLGRPKAAIAYLARAHQQDPRGPAPLLALGQAYLSLRDYTRSNTAYLEAAKLNAGNAEAWYGAGITYRSLANAAIKKAPPGAIPPEAERLLDLALQALTRAVTLQPDAPQAHLILAESYRDSGKFIDALAEYKAVLKLVPGDGAAELGLATTYWKAGEDGNALPALEKVLKKLPDDPEANGILAEIFVRKGEFGRAAPHARKALDGNPNLTQVRVALAKIYLDENKPEAAIAELQKALPADPDGSYHYLLHRALRLVGRDAEASAALEGFKRLRAASSVSPRKQM